MDLNKFKNTEPSDTSKVKAYAVNELVSMLNIGLCY